MGGGPPGFPQGFSCPVVLWILLAASRFRLPGFHLLWLAFPKPFDYRLAMLNAVRNPDCITTFGLASFHFARRYFENRCFFLFLRLLRCFSSAGLPSYYYFIHNMMLQYCYSGFPHSDICGSMDICSSPQLFAACHVLLRLLVPRHPPYALFCLTNWPA